MRRGIKDVLLALVVWMGMVAVGWSADLVWLCPAEPTKSFSGSIYASTDYYNLFTSTYSSQWSQARAKVNIFKVYLGFIQRSSDAQLQVMISYLSANKIKLALEWAPLVSDTYTLEGFCRPGQADSLCQRIQRLGGTIDYITLDEPLYFGHYYASGPQWSVLQVATQAAASLNVIKSYFPNVIIGDIEPIDAMPSTTWYSTMQQWLAAYQTVMGTPLAFIHVDNMWGNSWTTNISSLSGMLTGSNTSLGVIFNTLESTTTSSQWMLSAEVNIQRYNASGIVKPTHIVFQNWLPYPSTVMPESSTTAYTYLVNYYFSSYATQAPPQGFARLMKGGLHFYSANATEVSQFLAAGWVSEGTSGRVYATTGGAPGLSPFYRLSKTTSGITKYFYTANGTERSNCLNLYGFTDEGITGYVFTNASSGGKPLYRAYSATSGHFYTTSLTEYNSLAASWTKEGTSCYLP